MKRAGHLFERIVDRENLRLAFSKAILGKRDRRDARRFGDHLEANLLTMREGMMRGDLPVGRFHQFVIHDPKERVITAPCFEERVLHHAIMTVCEPVFERWLIADTYACRVSMGRLPALDRARQFARRFPVFLKLDIRKYFDSIPHDELLRRLARLFKDRSLLELLERNCRSANRNNNQPTNRNTNHGFRFVVSCGAGGQDSTRQARWLPGANSVVHGPRERRTTRGG